MRDRGFTLIELLVAMAVGGLVIAAALGVIYVSFPGAIRTNHTLVALTDIGQTALAIKSDLMMAQTTDLSATPKSSANLSWINYATFENSTQTAHSCVYTLSGFNLLRIYDGTTSIIGRRVSSINFTQNGTLITTIITTNSGGILPRTETIRFSEHIRAEE